MLHLPGQLAIYPILALDRLGLDVARLRGQASSGADQAVARFRSPRRTIPDQ